MEDTSEEKTNNLLGKRLKILAMKKRNDFSFIIFRIPLKNRYSIQFFNFQYQLY